MLLVEVPRMIQSLIMPLFIFIGYVQRYTYIYIYIYIYCMLMHNYFKWFTGTISWMQLYLGCAIKNVICIRSFDSSLHTKTYVNDLSYWSITSSYSKLQAVNKKNARMLKVVILVKLYKTIKHCFTIRLFIWIYIYQTLLSKGTYSAHSGYTFVLSVCVSWESNPQPLHC